MNALIACDKPVIAAVTGAAIGIGTTMLLHCDFVYVSDEARLVMPFVSLGLVPEFASSHLIPQLMGQRKAAEKLLLGDPFTGAEAVECGIANAVLPAGRSGAACAPCGRALQRAAAGRRARQQEADARRRGRASSTRPSTARTMSSPSACTSPEAKEAFSAFFQKRKPDFTPVLLSPWLLTRVKIGLLPVLLWQGRQVRRNALRLPEAEGAA